MFVEPESRFNNKEPNSGRTRMDATRHRTSTGATLAVSIIAAAPVIGQDEAGYFMLSPFNIEHEMHMVKAALLYADSVTLASPRVAAVLEWRELYDDPNGAGSDLERVQRAVQPYWAMNPNDAPIQVRTFRTARATLTRLLESISTRPSWNELEAARSTGLLELDRLDVMQLASFHPGAAIGAVIGVLADAVSPKNLKAPLIDAASAKVLNAVTSVGLLKEPLPRRATEITAASNYIRRIPAFPEAPIEIIVDARRALARPLVRFRAAMSELSEELASSPASDTFSRDADDFYRRRVAPEIAELEEIAAEQRFIPALTRVIAGKQAGAIVKATVGVAGAAAAAWPDIAQAAVGAAVAVADIGSGLYNHLRDLREQRGRNKLLWLYELERRLDKS